MTGASCRLHSDYVLLRGQLVSHGWRDTHTSDTTEWWEHPLHGELGVEIPATDPYESVTCWFDRIPTMLVLEQLRFPR